MGTIVRNCRIHLAGGKFWIGYGSTDRSSPAALWNGTQQCFAAIIFRSGRSQAPCASQQRHLCRRGRACGRICYQLWPRCGDAQFRRPNRFYGREYGGIRPISRSRARRQRGCAARYNCFGDCPRAVAESNIGIVGDSRYRIANSGSLDSATGWFCHLLLLVEEPELESLDRGWNLDDRGHRLRRNQDTRIPRQPDRFRTAGRGKLNLTPVLNGCDNTHGRISPYSILPLRYKASPFLARLPDMSL